MPDIIEKAVDTVSFRASAPGIFAEEMIRNQNFSMTTRHFHENFELYFLLEGERFYFVEQDTWHMREGMALLINRNHIHKTSTANAHSHHRRFLLHIDDAHFNFLLQLLDFPEYASFGDQYCGLAEFSPTDWSRAVQCIENLKFEMKQPDACAKPMIQLYVLELLTLFCRARTATEAVNWKNHVRKHTVHTGMHQTVHDIALYLQNNSAETLTLEDLAAHFYISKSYLTRIFKAVTGFTITEYLIFVRIKKAHILLSETNLSITDIALQTGFGTVTYFERVFKNTTAMTPLQYRKAMSAQEK